METGATGRPGAAPIRGSLHGSRPCCANNMVDVDIVGSSSCRRRFWKCITVISNAEITPIAIWWRFIVTVTTRYTEAVVIVRKGMVLLTKAVLLEEPCARKPACTVLQTSGGSDPFAEFNRALRPAVIARKVSQCSKNARGAQTLAAFTSVVRTLAKTGAESVVAGLLHVFHSAQMPDASAHACHQSR